ncbi:hypothetical protein T10_13104 [Trichinella papuae]|uniref:Uncharacterized protein n=1 Tax=Trichinella papuae TaxID=268474 RepID=A0A0V1MM37_9BILA|nr:hypothetical protein T10_13104 [Trichinella papuae]
MVGVKQAMKLKRPPPFESSETYNVPLNLILKAPPISIRAMGQIQCVDGAWHIVIMREREKKTVSTSSQEMCTDNGWTRNSGRTTQFTHQSSPNFAQSKSDDVKRKAEKHLREKLFYSVRGNFTISFTDYDDGAGDI